MCYYRDRSRKVSKRPTEWFLPRPRAEIFKGQSSGSHVPLIRSWTQSSCSAWRELLPKIEWMHCSGLKKATQARIN